MMSIIWPCIVVFVVVVAKGYIRKSLYDANYFACIFVVVVVVAKG